MEFLHDDQRMSVEDYFKLLESDRLHCYEYNNGSVHVIPGVTTSDLHVVLNSNHKSTPVGVGFYYTFGALFGNVPFAVYGSEYWYSPTNR